MSKRGQRDSSWWPPLLSVERWAHAPQVVTYGVVSLGLAGQFLGSAPCERPCANPDGRGAAVLPSEFDIDTVPTRTHEPVRGPGVITRGSADLR